MSAPPWAIADVVKRAKESAALASELGPFVLVGSLAGGDEGKWSFSTHSIPPGDADAVDARAFDLDRSLVWPLAKRTSTFAGTILLGRASSNDVCVDHTSVSKLHARARLGRDSFFIEDAGSRNGTYVEGMKISGEAEVCPGDMLRLGSCTLRVYGSERFCALMRRIAL
jgi:hypothetical protein